MTDTPSGRDDVLLVVMPFGPLAQPSLGLSLLRAGLGGRSARIEYFTIAFADLIGAELFQYIALEAPAEWILGDWIFSGALSEAASPDYLDKVVRNGHLGRPTEERIAQLERARGEADPFLEWCRERIVVRRPRIVGFTNAFAQQTAALALARRIKEADREIFVVFGGANCEGVMGREIARQFPWADAVVSGEGDRIFPELVERVHSGSSIDDLPGVYTRTNLALLDDPPRNAARIIDLDALPYPDYDDFFDQWEASETGSRLAPLVLFEGSRGCWWGAAQHCTFCGLNGTAMAFRSKSAARARDELHHLASRYKGQFIMAVDTILDHRYFESLIPELARSPPELEVFYALKSNLRKDQLRGLRDAGITRIQPGIESLSDDILKRMRKGETALQNIQLLKWCKELGLQPAWNLIWGFPGEPIDEYQRMADLLPLLTHFTPPQSAKSIRLDRYSPNFEQASAMGFEAVEPCPAYRHIYPLDREALHNLAYHFAFEYRDGRDCRSYTAPLLQAIDDWRRVHRDSDLFHVDRGGELMIWDLRPVASEALTVLTALDRSLYLACDGIRNVKSLAADSARATEEVERRLEPVIDRGLMLREGDRVLSLAVAGREQAP